jgi:iron complex transport system ATP-binding protein
MQTPLIDFRNITVLRRERRILDGFTLRVAGGENIAIIGPNGSGKSTLIKTITREYYPLAGDDVVFRIQGSSRWDIFALRSLLGIVSNDLQQECTRDITVHDTVMSGFFGSIGLFSNHERTPAMDATVRRVLAFLEIEQCAGRPVCELSSGEARRALIGRALVHDPRALILDEPTTSLDLHALHKFREVLRKIARAGKNLILVTHQLHDIIPEIDRVILMRNGAVFKDGAKRDVLTGPNLSELFQLPVRVEEHNGYFHTWS